VAHDGSWWWACGNWFWLAKILCCKWLRSCVASVLQVMSCFGFRCGGDSYRASVYIDSYSKPTAIRSAVIIVGHVCKLCWP
jgi:hypothetical protein